MNNPIKLDQQLRYLRYVTDLVAPDDPFPLYFRIRLMMMEEGRVDTALLDRLTQKLEGSEYWTDAFDRFGLHLADLTANQA